MRWKTMFLGWGPMGQSYRVRESAAGVWQAAFAENQIGVYPNPDAAKTACEDHLKAEGSPQAPVSASGGGENPPTAQTPASAPPKPAAKPAAAPTHRGRR